MKPLQKIGTFIRPYLLYLLGALLALLGVTAAQLAIPTIIGQVIDVGLEAGDVSYMLNAALLILGIGVVRALIAFVQRYLSEIVSIRVAYDVRNKLFRHIQHLSFSFHDHNQTGQLMSRCTEDIRAIQQFIGTGIIELTQITLIIIGTIALMILESPKLTLIALAPLIPLLFITADFGGRVSQMFYAIEKALGDLSSRLQENVTGVQVVRAFTREIHEMDRFDRSNKELYAARLHVINEWSKIMPTTNLLIAVGTIMILWFGGQMVIDGQLTVGQIVQFNAYMLLIASPAQQLTWHVNAAGEAAAGSRRIFEILDREPIIQSPPQPKSLENLSGKVEYKNVSFTYQGEDEPALIDVNFTAEPNQTIALIGATGSGKTSLINLLPRFYDVTDGEVLVDGTDVRQFDVQLLRRHIGIVLQTSLLFSSTIRENIAFGVPDASEEQIITAAKAAQAHEFITSFPENYDTIVGERGITLSGGQRQRVAIARALLINPRFLILDDSTSSVDTETEHLIQQALDNLMKDRTTFIIAQRLSSVRDADLILVLDQGRIAERGTHSELVLMDGLYKEIYDLQLTQHDQAQADIREADQERG
jgi:ATP-binding cassette subfamily B protein